MESIISALVSAIASIVVALISRTPAKQADQSYAPRQKGPSHSKWVLAMVVIALWLLLTPIVIHHDFPGINMFALFVFTGVVALYWPVNGWEAAAWTLGLHALNSIAEPIARMVGHNPYDPFAGYHASLILIWSSAAFANAFLVALLSNWRLRKLAAAGAADTATATPQTEMSQESRASQKLEAPATTANTDIASQLERLVQLRAAGSLLEDEFRAAKAKILGPGR